MQETLKPLYKEYKDKKYLVAVFHSGKENMKELIRDLLIYNKTRLRELEKEKEKENQPAAKKQRAVERELA